MKARAVSSKIPYANFIWDLENGSRILPDLFNERFGGYSSLCLHPTLRWLASGSLVGFVSLQTIEDGRFILSEQLHAGRISQVIFCGDSKRIVSGGEDGTVHLIEGR
jgi:WD40 repeat protein